MSNKILEQFIPTYQRQTLREMQKGEEGQYFTDRITEVTRIFESTPGPYGTEDTPTPDKIVCLHYFSAAGDWYIVEKDSPQSPGFGYTRLTACPDCADWGYIQISLLCNNPIIELDLHFSPRKASEVYAIKLNEDA